MLSLSRRLAAIAFATVLTSGCNSLTVAAIATPAHDARARQVLNEFVAGERDSILEHARFGDDTSAFNAGLAFLDSALQGRRVDSLQLIGAHKWSVNKTEQLMLTYEMRTERGWLAASVATLDSAGTWSLTGVHVEPLAGELEALNRFTLVGRGLAQYFGLALAMICMGASLAAAVFIASRRRYPKRWRWVAASLVGVTQVYVNWTTGAVATRMLAVQLFSASVVRPSVYAPWLLSFSLPVGAIVAMQRYRQWRVRSDVPLQFSADVKNAEQP